MKHPHFNPSRRRIAAAVLMALAMGSSAIAKDADIHFQSATPAKAVAPGTPAHGPIVRPTPAAPALPVPVPHASAPVTPSHAPSLAVVPSAGGAPVGPANDPVPADASDFYVREATLQREKALLTLQSNIADLKQKIADAQDSGASIPAPSVIVAPPAGMTPQNGIPGAPPSGGISSVSFSTSNDAAPMVPLRLGSVLSVGQDFQAVIFDHGVETAVHEGSVLTDGWRVVRLAPSTAVLVRGRSRKILHVSGG